MYEKNIQYNITKTFFKFSRLITGFFFLFHLFQKSDPENRIFLNYSSVLITLIFLFGIFLGFFIIGSNELKKNALFSKKINSFINNNWTKLGISLIIVGTLLFFITSFILIIIFNLSIIKAVLNRFFLLFLYFGLISSLFIFLENKYLKSNTISKGFKLLTEKINFLSAWVIKVSEQKLPNYVYLLTLIFILFSFYLFFPITTSEPIGSAGLYALMAKLIRENHFRLPLTVPFYGPGGFPFAYPPLGFYLMALFTGPIGISEMEYLHWAPAFFSVFSMVSFFLFVKEVIDIKTAFISTLLLFTSSRLFLFHGEAAGIIRGLAFFLLFLGLYFLSMYTKTKKLKFLLIGSLFFALVTLTHLSYAVFFGFSILMILITSKLNFKTKFFSLVFISFTGIVLTSPWWVMILNRYGIDVFINALHSHNNVSFVLSITKPGKFLNDSWIEYNRYLSTTPLMIGLSILGLVLLINKKNLLIPFLFIPAFFISEGDRYQVSVAAILSSTAILTVLNSLSTITFRKKFVITISIAALILINSIPSFNYIKQNTRTPLNNELLNLTTWVQDHTEKEDNYLFLSADVQAAEWFPYLAERTPLIGTWGGEWIGTYESQFSKLNEVINCAKSLSDPCITQIESKYKPNYLIIEIENQDQIFEIPNRNLIFESFPYLVYK